LAHQRLAVDRHNLGCFSSEPGAAVQTFR
jgi:hypothetical protein